MGYKIIQCQGTVSSVDDAMAEISSLKEEMEEHVSNMEEKLSHTEKFSRTQEAAEALAIEDIDVPAELGDIPITYHESVPTRKRQNISRQKRLDNAVAVLEAAESALMEYADTMDTAADEPDADKSLMEDDAADGTAARDLANDIRERIDAVADVEFPGMFG